MTLQLGMTALCAAQTTKPAELELGAPGIGVRFFVAKKIPISDPSGSDSMPLQLGMTALRAAQTTKPAELELGAPGNATPISDHFFRTVMATKNTLRVCEWYYKNKRRMNVSMRL